MSANSTTFTPFSRRQFMQAAGLLGAATFAAPPRLLAQDAEPATLGEKASLIRPAAPDVPGAVPLAPPDKQPPGLTLPEPQKKVGWAIVGLGDLAVKQILPAFGSAKVARLAALVSGHPEKARQLAGVYGIDRNAIHGYDNFDRIRDDTDIQVVYVVLPNSMHAEYSIRAAQAGKHVFCEKPMASTVAECEQMIAAASNAGRQLGIAYRLHYEPYNMAAMAMCEEKRFGPVKLFSATNCQSVEAPNIRLSGPLGGGPVGDVGIYCINAARYTIGEEPLEVLAVQTQPKSDPRFREVPESVAFQLRYPSGVIAECVCSFGTARSSSYEVICEKGTIRLDPAYPYHGQRLVTESKEKEVATRSEPSFEPVDQFAAEMDDFSQCILTDKPNRTPGELGLRDMRIVLAVMESARLGGTPVKLTSPPI